MKAARQQAIVDLLITHSSLTTETLSKQLNVSRETIRRDLSELQAQGKVLRNHGRAKVIHQRSQDSGDPFHMRLKSHYAHKADIAREALAWIDEGMVIALDASSTCWYLARQLPDRPLELTVKGGTEQTVPLDYSALPQTVLLEKGAGADLRTELTLPDGIQTIYGNAFRDCTALTSVYLPDSVSYMASSAFSGCANVVLSVAEGSYAEQWAITNNVKYVNHGSETTTLEAVEEPETTVPVEETPAVEETANVCGDELTWKLDEKTLTISGRGGMYSYDADNAAPWAAYADNIENIVIEKHVKTIGAYAFSGLEKLVSVSFDEESELEVIEEYAFAGCKELTEIKLPEKLEKLGEAAFADCEKLRSVELPESLVEFEIITIKPENEEELEDREPVEIFDGCDMSILTLTVVKGSAAEAYAVDNGITVVYTEEEVAEPVEEVTEAPAEEIPAEETPAEEAPVEETPAPAKESPAETPAPETEPAPDTQPEE